MPLKYHVYVECCNGKDKPAIRFNFTEEELVRLFVKPFTAGTPFIFCGRLLNPAKISNVVIFSSQEDASKLVLPNREEVANHPDKKFVIGYMLRGKLKTVQVCTDKYLPNSQKQSGVEKL
jgi:hypothetical protein